jgi:hypothetical protein
VAISALVHKHGSTASAAEQKPTQKISHHRFTMDHLIEQCDGIASANHDRKNLNLVIVYENVVSAARALRACDILRGDEPEEINLSIKVWKMDLLGMEDNRDQAAKAASKADVVIVSASGRDEISPFLRMWAESWLERVSSRSCSLLLLFGDHIGPRSLETAAYLWQKTAPRGIRFFSHPSMDGYEIETRPIRQRGLPEPLTAIGSEAWDWRPGDSILSRGIEDQSAFDIIESFGEHLRAHLEAERFSHAANGQ